MSGKVRLQVPICAIVYYLFGRRVDWRFEMKITTVLFDLDGTLLPMDQDVFVKSYFGGLAAKLAPKGYDADNLVKGIWAGTASMVKNNGEITNEEAFWNTFTALIGERVMDDMPLFDDFYRNEFNNTARVCGYDPRADETVKFLKARGIRVALATNPIFPSEATEARMRWAGLDKSDFDLVTTYNNSRYCKPNPKYYLDTTERLGVSPEECLMVGNDVSDDMVTARLGMKTFLLTDNLINKDSEDISKYPHGSFDELRDYLEELLTD